MNEYDVIIVGAGPAGSAAAKVVAERGFKVIFLEEHTVIGLPDHCWGLLSQTTRPAVIEELLGTLPRSVVSRKYRAIRIFAPSGKMVKEVSVEGTSDYLIQRDAFDRELAKLAINAGADLRLNTRVTGLIKQDGRIIGVTTNSTSIPNLYGKVVIAADGIEASHKGISNWEELTEAGQTFTSGIAIELTRVNDIEPDVREFHLGTFRERGWTGLNPRDSVSCTMDFRSMAEFEKVKADNYLLSNTLKDAVPIRVTGWYHRSDLGAGLPRLVKDGLLLAGAAANLQSVPVAIVSGRYAAEVAVEAIQENDVTAKKLSKYEDLCKSISRPGRGFSKAAPFSESSDEDIEKALPGIIERNEFAPVVPRPI